MPDSGWQLLRRRGDDGQDHSGSKEFKKRGQSMGGKPQANNLGATKPDDSRKVIRQLVRRSPAGEAVWADVPEIGMNIAEQLYRLERRQDNRHFLPTEMFGWQLNEDMEMEEKFRVAVRLSVGNKE